MGRSYWFECSKCGYRAKVSGGQDRGTDLFVETILCKDCKQLYDAVTRLRICDGQTVTEAEISAKLRGFSLNSSWSASAAPGFTNLVNRLPLSGLSRSRWVQYKPRCPVSSIHRIRGWIDPDKCPRCGVFLERNGLPFQVWE